VRYVDRDLGEAWARSSPPGPLPPTPKARALEMTREIEKAMEADLRQLPWMGEATRQQALLKLRANRNKMATRQVARYSPSASRATIFWAMWTAHRLPNR